MLRFEMNYFIFKIHVVVAISFLANKPTPKKRAKELNKTIHQRRYTDGNESYEKMLHVVCH